MKLVSCGCPYCRVGRKASRSQKIIRAKKRGHRSKVKSDLKQGKEPETRVLLPYW